MRVVISIVFLAFLSDLVAQYGVTDSLKMSKELDQIVITANLHLQIQDKQSTRSEF